MGTKSAERSDQRNGTVPRSSRLFAITLDLLRAGRRRAHDERDDLRPLLELCRGHRLVSVALRSAARPRLCLLCRRPITQQSGIPSRCNRQVPSLASQHLLRARLLDVLRHSRRESYPPAPPPPPPPLPRQSPRPPA